MSLIVNLKNSDNNVEIFNTRLVVKGYAWKPCIKFGGPGFGAVKYQNYFST